LYPFVCRKLSNASRGGMAARKPHLALLLVPVRFKRLACSHTPPASAGQFPTDEGIQ
jgi:hypothetical protein